MLPHLFPATDGNLTSQKPTSRARTLLRSREEEEERVENGNRNSFLGPVVNLMTHLNSALVLQVD